MGRVDVSIPYTKQENIPHYLPIKTKNEQKIETNFWFVSVRNRRQEFYYCKSTEQWPSRCQRKTLENYRERVLGQKTPTPESSTNSTQMSYAQTVAQTEAKMPPQTVPPMRPMTQKVSTNTTTSPKAITQVEKKNGKKTHLDIGSFNPSSPKWAVQGLTGLHPAATLTQFPLNCPNFGPRPPKCGLPEFGTKNITQDQTRYGYVVSALEAKTAEEVQDVLVKPPDADRYTTIKKALIKACGKSQVQRNSELLNLNGLGDRKPAALLRKINALNDHPQTLKRALSLSNLLADVLSILAGQEFSDVEKLAEAADRIWGARCAEVQHIT
ncbi:transposon Ty3-G Gag-Pol polyprotein [Elysia marginata]|uniref:Transposon Ty3-G Gag-Pol polyprotein n=1 Tax=Elysia marginata TaxID=1093978 RepID=A0AAV4GD06_9GAST|nr:transposon Ty3-G Gag-Pol polyprotein [Elysia marginata]